MESALDVLSRAASIVETNDKKAQDPLYKGLALPPLPPNLDRPSLDHSPSHREHIDHRASPGKELPTKHHKQERHSERFELAKSLHFDKGHTIQHQRRQELLCSASRTSRRSLTPEPYRNGETPRSSEGTYNIPPPHPSHHHQMLTQSISSRQNVRTPPPPHHGPPPRYPTIDYTTHHDGPLNLSLTNNNGNNNSADHSPSQSRPSVITCANTTSGLNGRYENGGSSSSSPVSREESAEVVDPDIEEHFRRSLGRSYTEILGKQPSMTPSPPPLSRSVPSMHLTTQTGTESPAHNETLSPSKTNVSITGSVDDHFARALGDKWSVLQNKKDSKQEVMSPGSVDDHFAKALGDTWLRIKAERESPRGPPPPFVGVQHQITHSLTRLPHPHNLSHPIQPRPSSPSSKNHNSSLLST